MSHAEILQSILSKYKFENPLPPEARKHALHIKKTILFDILKRAGKYNLLTMLVISLFFLTKRIGISISIAKSYIVVFISIALMTAGITRGGYLVYKYIMIEKPPVIIEPPKEISKIEKKVCTKILQREKTKKKIYTPYIIGIIPFEFSKEESDLARRVASRIGRELLRKKGAGNVLIMKNKFSSRKNSKNLLLGSVMKLGDSYRINIRVVETSSSKILLMTSETVDSLDDIDRACMKISRKIESKI